ncbi:PE family protein, partial [Mycobacterium tuberculosis]|uniref:PE family protein n=1 Tax=Mycobacterium tuberculosis TaxID=1773 RepID=UPI0021CABE4F
MSYVIAAPEMLATAAADVDGIGSAIRAASASAAGPTTGLLAAAADEVSSADAALFSEYARECQEVLKQAAAFHGEFTLALAAAGAAYAQAEA